MKNIFYIILFLTLGLQAQNPTIIAKARIGDFTPPSDTESPVIGTLNTPTLVTQTSMRLTWSEATDNVAVVNYDVYIDDNYTTTINALQYDVTGLSHSTQYDFKIRAKDAANNLSNFSNTVQGTTTTPPSGDTPLLSNFRIEDSQKSRVVFDATSDITGMTTTGFVISGKTISSVTIDGDGLGGYLTVSSAFDFWDNNTIRLESGGGTVYDFDMQYIDNNISEPSASVNRYVTTSATGSGDGTTEGTAWTWQQAFANSSAGQTVWVKAGNYGNINISISKNGTTNSPIKFIGYKNTIGDNPNVNWQHDGDKSLDAAEMPLIEGNKTNNSNGITITGDYLIFRNLQVTKFEQNIFITSGASQVMFDNIISSDVTNDGECWMSNSTAAYRNRIINSVAYNGGTHNIQFHGTYGLIEDCQIINDSNFADYYIKQSSNNNIVRGIYMERKLDQGHSGHGFSQKGNTGTTFANEYNLWENSSIGGIKLSIEARHDEAKYNVYRNIDCFDNGIVSQADRGGIVVSHGAESNVFDRIRVDNGKAGIYFYNDTEDPTAPTTGTLNIIKNCLIINCEYAIREDHNGDGNNTEIIDNEIINSTFYNNKNFYFNRTPDVVSNDIKNSLIVNTWGKEFSEATNQIPWNYLNCNFYNNTNFNEPSGNGNIEVNPNFVNTTDFVPTNNSLIVAPRISGVEYDYNVSERESTTTIGYIKDADE